MRSHAKAPSAGSILGIGGTGAPLARLALAPVLLAAVTLLSLALSAAPANAVEVHPFKEVFGSAAQPSFSAPLGLAVDHGNGDIVVIDKGANEKQELEIKVASGSVGGTFSLSFGGKTTGWTGTGTVNCNGSTSITGLSTSTGAIAARERISSSLATCIKPNTTITTCSPSCAAPTSITLSQGTEVNANSGVANLAADLTVTSSPSALTALQITSQIREALEKLPSVGLLNVGVSGTSTVSPVKRVIEFKSALASRDVEAVTCNGSGLTGTSPTCTLVTTVTGVEYGLKRFGADGSPANFSGLGTNVIDGRKGPGGKVCGEEASSCDETPLNALGFEFFPGEIQVAIDESGGATDGNIYLSQFVPLAVDIFSKEGKYLGQITKYKEGVEEKAFGEPCGVGVDASGTVFVGDYQKNQIYKYVPSANPPVNTDNSAVFTSITHPCNLAFGSGPTAGSLFVTAFNDPVYKLDSLTGTNPEVVSAVKSRTAATDPSTGNVLSAALSSSEGIVREYDASGAAPVLKSTLTAASEVQGVAVSKSTGDVYVSRAGSAKVEVFGPPARPPVAETKPATGVTLTTATLNGAVNPEGALLTKCVFEYGKTTSYNTTVPCAESLASIGSGTSPVPVHANLASLPPEATHHFRLVVESGAGVGEGMDKSFTTNTRIFTGVAMSVTDTTATLNGTVNPVGSPLTDCKFEYGLTTSYGATVPCSPAFGSIPTDSEFHAVAASLTGLTKVATYHFRLVAANAGGTFTGADATFTTIGPPQIAEELATAVGPTTATPQASLNPSGFSTNYHFEWASDAEWQETGEYGHRVPIFDRHRGADNEFLLVQDEISGLEPNTTYHFRLVATNVSGTTEGADTQFVTSEERQALNSQGLPDNRRFELVSPPDKRPQGAVIGKFTNFVHYQVGENGQSLLFPLLDGIEGTDSGGDASYLATREEFGWQSTKISPPSLVPAPTTGTQGNGSSGSVVYNSSDLSCGVVNTFNPLTEDTPVADVELGIYNLYRRNPDGSHTLITSTVPANPGLVPVGSATTWPGTVAGASADCSRIFFSSPYRYLPNASGFYEWDEGTLRDAGRLPNGTAAVGNLDTGGTGPIAFGGEYGANGARGTRVNSVSPDGRFFFSAISGASGTVGTPAVFVREDSEETDDPACQTSPQCTVEVSSKQGGPKDSKGAFYQTASPDGKHVLFTASYGLTPNSSTGPEEACSNTPFGSVKACDLYDYDVDTGTLTDLSADANPADSKGAAVAGVVGVSEDGSSVYFAARGQLVSGKGKTYAQNTPEPSNPAAGSVNVYLARNGQLTYVAMMTAADISAAFSGNVQGLIRADGWTGEVAPDGDHFIFESRASIAGYDSQGRPEAYLYSADANWVQCLSCRPDGLPPVPSLIRMLSTSFPSGPNFQSQPRKMSDDGSRAFFSSPDVLATGAVSGNMNLYEWERGQVYLLNTGAAGGSTAPSFFGASRSGKDIFFSTPQRLDAHDTDLVRDAYDARVDGGFPPPLPPPAACDPTVRDDCQGTPTTPPGASSPASEGVLSPGNPPLKPRPCPKGKVRRHGKCQKKTRHTQNRRTANTNHGGAK